MRTWMLLWAATASLVFALPALAETQGAVADDGLGLDFDDASLGAGPAAEPTVAATAEVEAGAGAAIAPPDDAALAGAGDTASAEAVDEATDLDETTLNGDADSATDDIAAMPVEERDVAPRQAAERTIVLGPMGVDAEGREGRIHTVTRGDTLWDISNAYLGTPWVWPSVWNDNDGISNPHLISPGDHIWITSGEMRIVTDAQKDELLAGADEDIAFEETDDFEEPPAALGDDDDLMTASEPTTMDELPVVVPIDAVDTSPTGAMVRVAEAESLGFVSPEELDAASSIVDSSVIRTWLVDGDEVYLGLGEGEVERGDDFTIYRDAREVRDLDGTLLGYHVEVLGWARVTDVEAESCKAQIRMSQSEIGRGDRVVPRDPVNISVPLRRSPDAVPGNIIYMPDSRTAMGDGEWVYLNRGNLHGIEPGTELEVYDPGRYLRDDVKRQKVMTPDHVIAQLIVVDTQPDSAVAYIVHTRRPLSVGDKVRPMTKKLAKR